MSKLKIYDFLASFTINELAQLAEYLILETKPKSDIQKIGTYILHHHTKILSAEDIQKAIFPSFTTKEVSNKVNILKNHIENYFSWKQLQKNKSLSGLLKYEALLKREHFAEANRIGNKLIKETKEQSTYNLNALHAISQIYHLGYHSHDELKADEGLNLLQLSYDTQKSELELRFKQYQIEEAVRKKKTKEEHNLIDTNQPSKDHPLSSVLDAVLRLEQSKENPIDLQSILNYLHSYAQEDIGEIYVFILLHTIDVLISKVQKEKSFDTSDLIKLYEIGLNNNAFLFRGNITPRRFGNIINAGFAMRDFSWMERIIKKNSKQLPKDSKDEVILMANIQVTIAKKEYQRAWDLFPPRGWNLFDHEYRSRWLSAICMYKLNEYQLLESHLTAFKSYANEKKAISPRLRTGIHNFVKIMRMFMKAKRKTIIRKEFLSMETVSGGSWIYHELNEDHPSKI